MLNISLLIITSTILIILEHFCFFHEFDRVDKIYNARIIYNGSNSNYLI